MNTRRKSSEVADIARLFTHGGSQAVRLPKAYRFVGKEVIIRREGESVILEPVEATPLSPADLESLWARIDALSDPVESFPAPPEQETAAPPRTW